MDPSLPVVLTPDTQFPPNMYPEVGMMISTDPSDPYCNIVRYANNTERLQYIVDANKIKEEMAWGNQHYVDNEDGSLRWVQNVWIPMVERFIETYTAYRVPTDIRTSFNGAREAVNLPKFNFPPVTSLEG